GGRGQVDVGGAPLDLVEGLEGTFSERHLRAAGECEERLGAGILQVVDDLARGQQNVERNDHGTGFEGAVVDEGEIGQVRARQRDAVAGPDASGHQKMGDLVGDHVGDRVVQAQVAEDQAVLLGNRSCTVFQDSGQVEH